MRRLFLIIAILLEVTGIAFAAESRDSKALKAELARKDQTAPTSTADSIETTIAEIKRLNAEIESIEVKVDRELAAEKKRITSRYSAEKDTLRQMAKKKQATLVRDEFETNDEYTARVAKQQSYYTDQITELERKQQREISDLEQRLNVEQQNLTADLRQSLRPLREKEFTLGSENVMMELSTYNPEKRYFLVTIRNKSLNTPSAEKMGKKKKTSIAQHKANLVNVAIKGSFPLPPDAARAFKKEFTEGLIRPLVKVRAFSGEVLTVTIVNELNNNAYEYVNGEFITAAEKLRREGIYYIDQQGLMWARNGNIADKIIKCANVKYWLEQFNLGEFKDWRLPTISEFTSFVELGGYEPSNWFNSNGFINVQSGPYMISIEGRTQWYVDMRNGDVKSHSLSGWGGTCKDTYVWPVRSKQF